MLLEGFAPAHLAGDPKAPPGVGRAAVGVGCKASQQLGLTAHATFSGALAWPFFYPWPQRPAGLIDEAFQELGRRWLPILQTFDEAGVDLCFELHPGEDLHDGVTFERFLCVVSDHPRANILYDPSHMVLQQLDYLAFLDIYHDRVRAFHVKDAEFRPNGRSGRLRRLSGLDRPARAFPLAGRRPGGFQLHLQQDGAIRLSGLGGAGVGVLPEASRRRARRRARPSFATIIRVTDRAFDDFAGSGADEEKNGRFWGW